MKRCTPVLSILFILITNKIFPQDTEKKTPLTFSAYADAYIAYYTDSINIDAYQLFPSVSPRSQQFGLNVAQLSVKYSAEKVRSTITLHYGDIPRSTWSPTFNFIQEANAGIRLCKKLWLDGGFFRTHIGTEGLFPKENITSSVAVATYYEPYYEAGFKLNYNPSDKVAVNLFLLNGYNLFEDNNKRKSVGLLVTDAVNDKISVGYNNYVGDDSPDDDTTGRIHFYNNVFFSYQTKRIKVSTGLDFCIQQHGDLSDATKSANMISGLLALQVHPCDHWNIYGRGEIFHDPNGIMSGVFFDKDFDLTGLELYGGTLGVEYKPTDNSYVRFEGRDLIASSNQEIFYWNGKPTNNRYETMLNFGVWFP